MAQIKSTTRRYRILNILGEGAFGKVFLAEKSRRLKVAVKVFNDPIEYKKELKIAKDICTKQLRGIAVYIDSGVIMDRAAARELKIKIGSAFIVYSYIETNLKRIYEVKRLSKRDILEIGIQLVQCAKNIHSVGYIHADIKLDNIMINSKNDVILLDYNLAQKYKLPDGAHRPNLENKDFGNPYFASCNIFNNHTLSRRDDLIQIIYNLMVLYNDFKPLIEFFGSCRDVQEVFERFKKEESAFNFCFNNRTVFLFEALEECYQTGYEDEPNYSKITFLLQNVLLKLNQIPGGKYKLRRESHSLIESDIED